MQKTEKSGWQCDDRAELKDSNEAQSAVPAGTEGEDGTASLLAKLVARENLNTAYEKVLLMEPHILLLDEPTKGLDAEILLSLMRRGVTIVMVSHDIEFCARYAHRCAMFFDGSIVT